jgi:hypothetical protein
MLLRMRAESGRRWLARGVVAALFSTVLVAAPPAPPKAHAVPNPCNLPGGDTACEMAGKSAKWVAENVPGAKSAGEAANGVVDGVGEAVDFASDPLGYLEQKLRSGTKGMFSAFGEELTGKKPKDPDDGAKRGIGKKGKGD